MLRNRPCPACVPCRHTVSLFYYYYYYYFLKKLVSPVIFGMLALVYISGGIQSRQRTVLPRNEAGASS